MTALVDRITTDVESNRSRLLSIMICTDTVAVDSDLPPGDNPIAVNKYIISFLHAIYLIHNEGK